MIQQKEKNKTLLKLARAFGLAAGLTASGYALADEVPEGCHFIESGEASWYGPGFNGKKTASGQTFNQNAMTAAHNSLPFGTVVTVVSENGQTAELRINDTGGFGKYNRILDASMAGAVALGYKDQGTAEVSLYIC